MEPQQCCVCGGEAELPETFVSWSTRDKSKVKIPVCIECAEGFREESRLDAAQKRGEVCSFCYAELNDPPGGTTLHLDKPFPGMPQIMRVCQNCFDQMEKPSTQS